MRELRSLHSCSLLFPVVFVFICGFFEHITSILVYFNPVPFNTSASSVQAFILVYFNLYSYPL